MHRSAQGRQIAFTLHHHPQQEAEDGEAGTQKVYPALRRHTLHREIK